ncbi:MAG: MFS transporter [Candidatus Nanopelagicales bacterium]
MSSTATAWADVRGVLHGPFRILAVGRLLDSVGSGLTMSLLVVYLAEVRGLPILTATLVLSWMAVVGLVVTPVAGTCTDRFGPRPVMLTAVVIEAIGVFLTAFVTNAPSAFAVATLVSLGGAGIWGPAMTFTARLVREDQRPTAFALNFMLLNLGLGIGGLVAAFIVDIARPVTFQWLYFIDAATYATLWVAVFLLRGHGGPSPASPGDEQEGWGRVLRDGRLLGLIAVSLVLLICGYGSMEAGLSIYITRVADESERLIGIVFLANTLTIVAAQILVLGWLRGRSRVRMIGVTALLWGIAWLLIIPAPLAGRVAGAALLIAFGVVFALGESVWSATIPALVNGIAPDHLRGRYNSAQSLTWALSSMLAPIPAGLLIGGGLGMLWATAVGLGCLVAGAGAQLLRRRLTPEEDGRV